MTIPDRKPDREYKFPIDTDPMPTPDEFVEILTAEGFTFDRTTCPISLRQPKARYETETHVVFQQWDQS